MTNALFSIVMWSVGLAIGIPSYFTWSRRWPGMIAGFDPARCTDVDGLTRRVGLAGMAIGLLYLLAGAVSYLVPQSMVALGVAIGLGSVGGLGVTMRACSRFTRR